jgi:type I restriction enzyme S subunit
MGRWIRATLGELTSKIGSGATPLGGEAAYQAEGVSLIRSLNVHDGEFRRKDLAFLSQQQADGLANVVVQSNDVLLNITGASVARCCTAPDNVLPARVNQHVAIIRPLPDRLSPRFLQYLLVSPAYKDLLLSTGEGTGATRQALTKAQLQNFFVEFPASLQEQTRIVNTLDEAFEGIAIAKANAEKNLQNACELFEVHLERVFSTGEEEWISTKLGDAFKTLTGNTPSKGNAAYFGEFMPLVKPPELIDDYVDEAADGLSLAGVEVARVLPIGSVMVSCIGNLGKVGINSVQVACNQQINAILPDARSTLPEFMFFQALARPFKRQLNAAASGTTVPIVNKSKFNDVQILLPPIWKQQEVVDSLRDLRVESRRLAAIYDQQRAAIDELKQSLLHQAFTGALTDRSANKRVAEVA